jgi:hypothetical protein
MTDSIDVATNWLLRWGIIAGTFLWFVALIVFSASDGPNTFSVIALLYLGASTIGAIMWVILSVTTISEALKTRAKKAKGDRYADYSTSEKLWLDRLEILGNWLSSKSKKPE